MEIPIEINMRAAEYAKQFGKFLICWKFILQDIMVALDMGGDDVPLPEEFLKNLDFLTPNETEL